VKGSKYGATVNIADKDSKASSLIAKSWVEQLPGECGRKISGQTAGKRFEEEVKKFLESGFQLIRNLRPGEFKWSLGTSVHRFDQYTHLELIDQMLDGRPDLKSSMGEDYLIEPDVVVAREPVNTDLIGGRTYDSAALHTPLLKGAIGGDRPILHASISCKLTMRSDRAQNTRVEALNLIRNRKGRAPHIVAVTAEPMPSRLASLALGTGDIDCVYHAGLYELQKSVETHSGDVGRELMSTLIEGRRLRDISDLPFDLAV
jgi:hypothetical protein